MPILLYASTRDANAFYAIKAKVADAFYFLDTGESQYAFVDHREIGALREHASKNVKVVLLAEILNEMKASGIDSNCDVAMSYFLLHKYGLVEKEIVVADNLRIDVYEYLKRKGVKLKVEAEVFCERRVKDNEEIECIRENCLNVGFAFDYIKGVLRESTIRGDRIVFNGMELTSEFLKRGVAKILIDRDMTLDEGVIISSGVQSSMPHHMGSGFILPHVPIICDIFPRSIKNGYFADMTRTFFKGEPDARVKKMYEAVLRIQEESIGMVSCGVTGREIYDYCVSAFIESGYDVGDKGFTHGTGHGLGIEIHEQPNVNKANDKKFMAGNVITIEPGLYYEELGGIRIEDDVLVKKDGYEVLSEYCKEFKVF